MTANITTIIIKKRTSVFSLKDYLVKLYNPNEVKVGCRDTFKMSDEYSDLVNNIISSSLADIYNDTRDKFIKITVTDKTQIESILTAINFNDIVSEHENEVEKINAGREALLNSEAYKQQERELKKWRQLKAKCGELFQDRKFKKEMIAKIESLFPKIGIVNRKVRFRSNKIRGKNDYRFEIYETLSGYKNSTFNFSHFDKKFCEALQQSDFDINDQNFIDYLVLKLIKYKTSSDLRAKEYKEKVQEGYYEELVLKKLQRDTVVDLLEIIGNKAFVKYHPKFNRKELDIDTFTDEEIEEIFDSMS